VQESPSEIPVDLDRLARVRRVNVIGTSGSGKTTFGRRLAEILQIPFFEMDHLFWKPDWQESTDEEFLPRLQEVTSRDEWVLDGNYSRMNAIKWQNVDMIVWIDRSLVRTLYQITARSLRRAVTRAEIWKGTGNRESLRRSFFSHESVILWSLTSHRVNRRRYTAAMQDPELARIWFVRLRTAKAVEQFLNAAEQAAGRRQLTTKPRLHESGCRQSD